MKEYKKFYEKYSKTYPDDLVVRGSQLAKIKELLQYKGKIGLDIGCANGAFAIELAKSGAKKVYGIDIADSFVKRARLNGKKQHVKNVQFSRANGKKLPFKSSFFDFIICTEVLEHVPNFKQVIKEIRRVLKPQASFVVTVPNSFNPAEIIHQLKHLIFYVLRKEPITHINLFFIPTFEKHFKWATNKKIEPLHFLTPFISRNFINLFLIKVDIFLGKFFKILAFDIVLKGEKYD